MEAQRLRLPEDVWQQMRSQVIAQAPEEACGLLAGADSEVKLVYPITNSLHSPTRFRMEPREQLRAFLEIERAGLDLLAIYHSHPQGPPSPSRTDVLEFAYPGTITIIWDGSGNEWKAEGFTLDNGTISPVSLLRLRD